ncbi:MAG: hypothetical protein M1840_003931 [Geoglossum simile]|nr:MAG: hypothetical protein M1840_003931 [Geoglossum simile]
MSNGAGSAGPGAAAAFLSAAASTSTGSAEYPRDLDEEDGMIKEEGEGEESDVEQVRKSFGFMKVDKHHSFYVADSHWAAILSDITEVKNYWAKHKKQYEEQMIKVKAANELHGTPKFSLFLYGAAGPIDKSELLSAIPSRPLVDKLIVRYFNSYDPVVHILHAPTFQNEYEQHWGDQGSTRVVWIGLLFSIMCLAMQSYARTGDEPPEYRGKADETAEMFKSRTAQSLVLADYTKTAPYTIETLILHLHAENACGKDIEVVPWVAGGMIVRLAMRMGYHRDPKPYPDVSQFQGEMRRRVWTFVKQMDLGISFQVGLPSLVRSNECDTDIPRNLFDEEFSEGMTELPPGRPLTEPTPISYTITKSRLIAVFGRILELFNSLEPRLYEDVMKLDAELQEERELIPPHLRFVPIEESVTEPAALILQRYDLDLLYHKGLCVLHRKFLARARGNPRFSRSRLTCVDASMVLLAHQVTLHRETVSTAGRLRSIRWLTPSLTTSDFLQAAMIICLDLYHSTKEADGGSGKYFIAWDQERQTEMLRALETANSIWVELKDTSIEAYKACTSITMMLQNLPTSRQKTHPSVAQVPGNQFKEMGAGAFARGSQDFGHDSSKPEHSAAMTLNMLSGGGLTQNSVTPFSGRLQPDTVEGNINNINMGDAPGLVPMYPSLETSVSGGGGVGSPFSMLFGASGGMMDLSGNLDWVGIPSTLREAALNANMFVQDAWDSYVEGTSLDPSNQLWPPSVDLPTVSPPEQQTTSPDAQHQNTLGGNVFMGVSTPR